MNFRTVLEAQLRYFILGSNSLNSVKPKVVARNLRGADPQFKANEEKRLRKIEETQSRIHPRFLQKVIFQNLQLHHDNGLTLSSPKLQFDQEDARLNCESAIKKVVVMTDDPQIDEQLEKITEDKIQVCTLDLTVNELRLV